MFALFRGSLRLLSAGETACVLGSDFESGSWGRSLFMLFILMEACIEMGSSAKVSRVREDLSERC
jgi:hypothetical protein